jgi:uncharacterized protein (DUF433 family)
MYKGGETMRKFERISHNADIMGGKACIKGTRVTVSMIIAQLSEGNTPEELIEEYPYIALADISEALKYAAWLASGKEMELATA